jgi:predicted dienelactone hydrolase
MMRSLRLLASALALLLSSLAQAGMGLGTIAATAEDGPVTLYYPSADAEQAVRRGPFTLQVAPQGQPVRGNGRLVVISHGSGGSPWVHADLARRLVEAGFVVALPEHRADNYRDHSAPGPDSWSLRPAEVSRAIDAVGRDARLAPLLQLDKVGVYGMSAGGHAALSLAGGRWSPAGFRRHCEAHLEQDFQSCVGLFTRLTGGPLDGIKKWAALTAIRWRFDDDTPRVHVDPRVAAVVAGVPFSADFDMASLAAPPVPLGLVTAQQDRWLIPRFHGDRVVAACKTCELIADLPTAGHGALLSPPPPGLTGLVGDMLNDPPGFDRAATMPAVDRKITAFFAKHLLQERPSGGQASPG